MLLISTTPKRLGSFTSYAKMCAPLIFLDVVLRTLESSDPKNKLSPNIKHTFEEPINFSAKIKVVAIPSGFS